MPKTIALNIELLGAGSNPRKVQESQMPCSNAPSCPVYVRPYRYARQFSDADSERATLRERAIHSRLMYLGQRVAENSSWLHTELFDTRTRSREIFEEVYDQ